MSPASQPEEQRHPQQKPDRETVNRLLREGPTDYNLVELARLKVRYHQFPGARDIQRDLDLLLAQWQLTEAQLYEKTRQLHGQGSSYRQRSREERQDWS